MTNDDAFDRRIKALLADDPIDLEADAARFSDAVLAGLGRHRRRRLAVILGAALTGGTIAALQAPALAAEIEAYAADSPGVLAALNYFGPEAIAALALAAMLAAFALVAPSDV